MHRLLDFNQSQWLKLYVELHIRESKVRLTLNKPAYVRIQSLDLSKVLMYSITITLKINILTT